MTNGSYTPEEERQRAFRARRTMTRLIVFAIVMFFAGLTSAYVVSMSGGYWVRFDLPRPFTWSTVAILLSSVTAQLALWSARRGSPGRIHALLLATLVLGSAFAWFQFQGWGELVRKGNYVVGKMLDNSGLYGEDWTITYKGETLVLENGNFYRPSDGPQAKPLNAELDEQRNTASSYFYVLTAAHLAHLFFGLVALVVMTIMALLGRYTRDDHAGLWSGVVYWHFLGGLWVYLLLFLGLIH